MCYVNVSNHICSLVLRRGFLIRCAILVNGIQDIGIIINGNQDIGIIINGIQDIGIIKYGIQDIINGMLEFSFDLVHSNPVPT